MYSVSLLVLVLSVRTDGLFSNNVPWCHYKFQQKYPKDDYNIVGYNSSFINYCTADDVPYNMSFNVYLDESKKGDETDSIKIEFAPPKRECKYGISLLVNPLIKDETECKEYNFKKVDDIKSMIHTGEKNVCVFKNTNQSTLVRYNDNSPVFLYEVINNNLMTK